MEDVCPLCLAEASATSMAVLKNSTSSDVSSDWFGHDVRNSRTRSIVWRSLSFVQDWVTEPPSRVAASSPFTFLFAVPPMSELLKESAERDGTSAGWMDSAERDSTCAGAAGFGTDIFLHDIARQQCVVRFLYGNASERAI